MQPDVQQYMKRLQDGDYFEAHEVLEDRWRVSRSPSLQGLIQFAAGLHHLSHGNLQGGRALWTKAARYLERAADAPEPGVDAERLRAWLLAALQSLPPGRRVDGRLPDGILPPEHLPFPPLPTA